MIRDISPSPESKPLKTQLSRQLSLKMKTTNNTTVAAWPSASILAKFFLLSLVVLGIPAAALAQTTTQVTSTSYAFAALMSDGSVLAWGDSGQGGSINGVSGLDSGVTKIFATNKAFAARLKMMVLSLHGVTLTMLEIAVLLRIH